MMPSQSNTQALSFSLSCADLQNHQNYIPQKYVGKHSANVKAKNTRHLSTKPSAQEAKAML